MALLLNNWCFMSIQHLLSQYFAQAPVPDLGMRFESNSREV